MGYKKFKYAVAIECIAIALLANPSPLLSIAFTIDYYNHMIFDYVVTVITLSCCHNMKWAYL